MTRAINRRPTERRQVDSPAESQAPGYSVASRLTGGGSRPGAIEAANELQRMFNNGAQAAVQIAAQKSQERFNQGEADARMGRIDPETRSRYEAYNNAATQVEAESMIIKDEAEIEELAKPLIEAGDIDGVDQLVQQEYAKRWAGVNGSEMEHVVTPWMGAFHAKLAAKTIESARVIDEQNNTANLQIVADGLAKSAAESDGNFAYASFHERAVGLFGKASSIAVEAKILENTIRAGVNPHVYDSIPDRHEDGTPTLKNHPIYGPQLRAAYEFANAELQKGHEADMARNKAAFFDDYLTHNRQGKFYDDEKLLDALDMGWITPQQYASMKDDNLTTIQTKIEKAADQINLFEHFRNRTAYRVKGQYADEDVKDQFDEYIRATAPQSEDPNAMIDYVAAESAGNGMVFREYQEMLKAPNLENPQAFAERVNLFDRLFASNPVVARNYVDDEQTWELYNTASVLKQAGYDPQQMLVALTTTDLQERKSHFMEGDIRKQAVKALSDAELGRPGRWFNADLKDLPANSRAVYARELSRRVDALGSTGAFPTAELLLEAATKSMEGQYMVAGGRLMRRPKSAPADADKAMTWFVTDGVSQVLPPGLTPDDVELVADSRSNYDGTYRLVRKGTIEPINVDQRYRLDEIVNGYRENGALENAEPYRTRWQSVIDNKDITTPGAPALVNSSVTLPKIDKYAEERKYLLPEQRRALDARYLETARKKAADANRLLAKWINHKAVPHASGLHEKARETRWAQQKADYWNQAVADMERSVTEPQVTPTPAPAAAQEPPPALSGKLTARDWEQHPQSYQYKPMVAETERAYELPPGMLGRLLFQESRFNPKASNKSGASGIAQIIPRWHPGVDPWNPTEAVPYAAGYLRRLHKRFGSWDKALAAYNYGEGPDRLPRVLAKYGPNWLDHVPKETRDYVRAIAPTDV
jgi:soluble lytic murein transglycosylase-like protein